MASCLTKPILGMCSTEHARHKCTGADMMRQALGCPSKQGNKCHQQLMWLQYSCTISEPLCSVCKQIASKHARKHQVTCHAPTCWLWCVRCVPEDRWPDPPTSGPDPPVSVPS